MIAYDPGSASATGGLPVPPTWVRVLLGIVLVSAGLVVLADLALVAVISTIFIGSVAVAVGIFEILHAVWTRGAGGLLWRTLLGVLYLAVGIVLLRQPSSGALILTYVLGLLLLLSGLVRIRLGVGYWKEHGWVMLLSGLFGVLAGLAVLAGFPRTTLWVLALLLGSDLIAHGVAWLSMQLVPNPAQREGVSNAER
jgi:uncharacterized membrane protein HdeD (DUF308 family)